MTGCLGKSPVSPGPLDHQLVLAPGQSVSVDPALRLRFVAVIGDSRCPGDALCITGGDAIVRITPSPPGRSTRPSTAPRCASCGNRSESAAVSDSKSRGAGAVAGTLG